MDYFKKYKVAIIAIVALIIMLIGVLFWNKIILMNKENETTPAVKDIDISDVSNIDSVESKLGQPMKITQGYLLKYTTNKSGIWYMSSAKVKKITIKDDIATITLVSNDGKNSMIGTITKDKIDIKKDDNVNFVGSVNFENGGLDLTIISKDKINYNDVTEIEFNSFIDMMNKLLKNQFVISGYMVTDKDKYKLFESKTAYNKTDKVGTFFTLDWKDSFNYTGNANVTVICNIADTYKLKNCEMLD